MMMRTTRSMAMEAFSTRRKVVFGRYVDNVDEFIAVLRDTHSVVGGSACFPILMGSVLWRPHDFDLFCLKDGFETLCIYAVDKLGGKVVEHLDTEDFAQTYPLDCPPGVAERRRIQTKSAIFDIHCSTSLSASFPITQSFSTITMNSIGADNFCIAYPWTFAERIGVLRTTDIWSNYAILLDKYVGRGYLFRDTLQEAINLPWFGDCASNGYCAKTRRYFGDNNCLSVSFNPSDELMGSVQSGRLASVGHESPGMTWTSAWVFGGEGCANMLCPVKCDSYAEPVLLCRTHDIQ